MTKTTQQAGAIPTTQKAAVAKPGSTHITYEDIPVPTLKPGEILVKINWSGLCYNDVRPLRDHNPHNPRTAVFQNSARGISGHEGVGNVVAMADDVADEKLWNLGDRVGIKWVASACRQCEFCTNGSDEVNCPDGVYSGLSTPGTFQQYVATDARFALRIPDGVLDEEAAPLLCSGLTLYTATKRSEVKAGQWIVYLGGGGGGGHVRFLLTPGGQLDEWLTMQRIARNSVRQSHGPACHCHGCGRRQGKAVS